MTDQFMPVDTQYLERVNGHLANLERQGIKSREAILHTQRELIRSTAALELEMAELKGELVSLDKEMRSTIERVKYVVNCFRVAVKKGDVARLQSRIDLWAPEQRVTRAQFKRMLQDSLT